ncbi:MAG TPA: hypothetical protein VNZ52_13890, partial [Candidatus Thermoplasmatota archaeon]|nr:hypothetical protein [Candidatus Thermoplasmatota archaeon]
SEARSLVPHRRAQARVRLRAFRLPLAVIRYAVPLPTLKGRARPKDTSESSGANSGSFPTSAERTRLHGRPVIRASCPTWASPRELSVSSTRRRVRLRWTERS